MTETISSELAKVQLLDYYYQRRAESTIGNGERFVLSKAIFGTSALVTENSNGMYDIADIPADFRLSDLTSQISTSDLTLSLSDGVITLRAEVKAADLEANKSYPFNTLVVIDGEGEACLVQCVQQDSLYQGKAYVSVTNINTVVA